MPHGYNVQLPTPFKIEMSKKLSNFLLSAEFSNGMRPSAAFGSSRTRPRSSSVPGPTVTPPNVNNLARFPSNYSLLGPPPLHPHFANSYHYFGPSFQVRSFMVNQRMPKAQELPSPMSEGQYDMSASGSGLKRSSKSHEMSSTPKISCVKNDEVETRDITENEINSLMERHRRWDLTDLGARQLRHKMPGMELTLLSYNVLAQCLLEENSYLYTRCQQHCLTWDYRKTRLLKELTNMSADIVCLQEVQYQHFNKFFVPEMEKLGYKGVYKKRTGYKFDGCAIFYKKAKFKLSELKEVEFCKPGLQILDRDNVGMVAMLEPTDANSGFRGQLCVANTHLLFNPGRGDIKLAQLKILLAEIDNLAFQRFAHSGKPLYHPVIMCGDFNSEPHCYLYRFLSRGSLHYEGLTAGDISGQWDGYSKGRFPLHKEVFPSDMGISDNCQFIETVRMRNGSKEESSKDSKQSNSGANLQFTGRMSHCLNFISAYKHWVNKASTKQMEVTTNQKRGCTVDYIFYSVQQKRSTIHNHQVVHNDVRENSLGLLGTYGLLTDNELQTIGQLPNPALPSDHLPIMAKFLLRDY